MKYTITISNPGLQYLYAVVSKILLNSRQTIKNVAQIIDIIRPVVNDFEIKQNQLEVPADGKKKLRADKKKLHEAKLRSARLLEAGEKLTEGSVLPYEGPDSQQAVEAEIKALEDEIDVIWNDRKALRETTVSITFNDEQFTALNSGFDSVIASWRDEQNQGISGVEDASLLNESIIALETADKQ